MHYESYFSTFSHKWKVKEHFNVSILFSTEKNQLPFLKILFKRNAIAFVKMFVFFQSKITVYLFIFQAPRTELVILLANTETSSNYCEVPWSFLLQKKFSFFIESLQFSSEYFQTLQKSFQKLAMLKRIRWPGGVHLLPILYCRINIWIKISFHLFFKNLNSTRWQQTIKFYSFTPFIKKLFFSRRNQNLRLFWRRNNFQSHTKTTNSPKVAVCETFPKIHIQCTVNKFFLVSLAISECAIY